MFSEFDFEVVCEVWVDEIWFVLFNGWSFGCVVGIVDFVVCGLM